MPGASRFENKVCVVTGGAGGIGAAVVRRLHSEGAHVAILDLADEAGESLAAELRAAGGGGGGGHVLYVHTNVASETEVEAAFHRVEEEFAPRVAAAATATAAGATASSPSIPFAVDSLICMAAVFVYGEVHTASSADWDRVLAVNVKGSAFCCRAVLPAMRARGRGGSIVLTSSITGTIAFPAFVPYSATKAALIQMTRDIALDNGKFGIRVNCCAPGPIFTQGGTVAHAKSEGRAVEDVCAELSREVSLRRMGTVDECAGAVCFLASDDAGYVTGETLMCDGGFTRK
jgi:NAD(P)-dependent dehydrogenase (short-subunit alcohol dehydrogenase family)